MSADTGKNRSKTERSARGHDTHVHGALALDLSSQVFTDTFTPPAFDDVYEEYFDFVWRSARKLGVADASIDDVVQDVFLVVHRRLDVFEGRSSLKTWLFAIVLRVVSDYRRTKRRKGGLAPLPDEIIDLRCSSPAHDAERAESVALLGRLLDELDEAKRTVFVLAELEDATAPEMAEMLGIPLNTVYSRLRAARIEFERALSRHRAREAHHEALVVGGNA